MLFIEKTFVLWLCLRPVLLNGTSLTPMFWKWGSAELGEENRKHSEMCFWNKHFFFFALTFEFDLSLWFFCFSLWIWPFCRGRVCQMRWQVPVPWGQWVLHALAYALLAVLPGELCSCAQLWGGVWPHRGATAPYCVWESRALHWGLACCWQTWRQPQSA